MEKQMEGCHSAGQRSPAYVLMRSYPCRAKLNTLAAAWPPNQKGRIADQSDPAQSGSEPNANPETLRNANKADFRLTGNAERRFA